MSKRHLKASVQTSPERWVRWRNDTGRAVNVKVDGKLVEGWIPTRVVSLPEHATQVAEAAGLTRLGYAQ